MRNNMGVSQELFELTAPLHFIVYLGTHDFFFSFIFAFKLKMLNYEKNRTSNNCKWRSVRVFKDYNTKVMVLKTTWSFRTKTSNGTDLRNMMSQNHFARICSSNGSCT